jgi:hypothetical protein
MTNHLNQLDATVNKQHPPAACDKHREWLAGVLAALGILGFAVGMVLMLPLAMATDSCHEGRARWLHVLQIILNHLKSGLGF